MDRTFAKYYPMCKILSEKNTQVSQAEVLELFKKTLEKAPVNELLMLRDHLVDWLILSAMSKK